VVAHEGRACEVVSLVAFAEEGKVEVNASANAALTMSEAGLQVLCVREVAIRARGCGTSTALARETCLLPCLPR